MPEKCPTTDMIAVQTTGAPAMVDSWKTGTLISYETIDTIADGIGVRLPVEEALEDMQGITDDAILVDDTSIIEGMKLIHTHVGVVVEPSSAVGVAAILENKDRFKDKLVGTIICGSNLTNEQIRQWLTQ